MAINAAPGAIPTESDAARAARYDQYLKQYDTMFGGGEPVGEQGFGMDAVDAFQSGLLGGFRGELETANNLLGGSQGIESDIASLRGMEEAQYQQMSPLGQEAASQKFLSD